MNKLVIALVVFLLAGFIRLQIAQAQPAGGKGMSTSGTPKLETAYFGAGCFWKVQYVFSKVPGVVHTRAGYQGGNMVKPSYEDVCSHTTGHAEVVKVEFDPTKTSYHKLLETFWGNHDPTTMNRQGPDIGDQYRSVIFYTTPQQKEEATKYKQELEKAGRFASPIVTLIEPAEPFYAAEDYHQDYVKKHGQVCY